MELVAVDVLPVLLGSEHACSFMKRRRAEGDGENLEMENLWDSMTPLLNVLMSQGSTVAQW